MIAIALFPVAVSNPERSTLELRVLTQYQIKNTVAQPDHRYSALASLRKYQIKNTVAGLRKSLVIAIAQPGNLRHYRYRNVSGNSLII